MPQPQSTPQVLFGDEDANPSGVALGTRTVIRDRVKWCKPRYFDRYERASQEGFVLVWFTDGPPALNPTHVPEAAILRYPRPGVQGEAAPEVARDPQPHPADTLF